MSSVVTLRPGMLVSLRTRMSGGVSYQRVDLDKDKPTDGPSVEKWETTKVVQDPEEFDRATKVRGKCGSLVRSVCSYSAFGLLCPNDKAERLDAAIAEARALADAFNASAATIQIGVYVMKAIIAENDAEAARAIASEMRELLDEMRGGILQANVKQIREAAVKAKSIGAMLDPEAGKRVAKAVEEARAVAKELTKRLVDDADSVADYVQTVALKSMDEARFAFLDMDDPASGEIAPVAAAPVVQLDVDAADAVDEDARQVNFEDDSDMKAAAGERGPAYEI